MPSIFRIMYDLETTKSTNNNLLIIFLKTAKSGHLIIYLPDYLKAEFKDSLKIWLLWFWYQTRLESAILDVFETILALKYSFLKIDP